MPNTEDLGIAHTHSIVAEMGYFFREQSKHDFGIDAHIEIANDAGKGMGRNLALQIRSGKSYIKIDINGNIVHNTTQRHITYWAEHSLPVLLVIYDPDQRSAWWCDVKAYISRHPRMLKHKPYVIRIPQSQILNANSKEQFRQIAEVPTHSLTLDHSHFTTVSVYDISTAAAKRYRAEILVGNHVNTDIVRLAIYQATQHFKGVVEHSSLHREQQWGNQEPHLITLFVYKDLDDLAHTNWVARSLWRDAKSEAAKLVKLYKEHDCVEDIKIQFADISQHQAWKAQVEKRVTSKTQFIREVDKWIVEADLLIEKAQQLVDQLDTSAIDVTIFESEMIALAEQYLSINFNYDKNIAGPAECRDAEERYLATIGSGGNVFIAFTSGSLETWKDKNQRLYLVRSYLDQYTEDRSMLRFEMQKLTM